MSGIRSVLESIPSLGFHLFLGDLRCVIYDAHRLPEVGNRIGIVRIVGQIPDALRQLIQIGDDIFVQRLQLAGRDQPFDHVVARYDYVPRVLAAHLQPQVFIAFEGLVVHTHVVDLLEFPDYAHVHIFAPVIDIQRLSPEFFGIKFLRHPRQGHQGQHQGYRQQNHLFHVQVSSFLFFLSLRAGIRLAATRIRVTAITISVLSAFTLGLNRFME